MIFSMDYYKISPGSNYKEIPMEPGSSSKIPRSALSTIPSMVTTSLPKISDYKILQQIWSNIFKDKKYPKELKRYDGNDNQWHKVKDNGESTTSGEQCIFILKLSYIPPDESDLYAFNITYMEDGYIFKILDLNIPTNNSHQLRNALERL